jgi:hypothetical protein
VAGIFEDPIDKLYTGALLGSALAKQVGESGAYGGDIKLSIRRAELTAGIASGKIKGASLGASDASLLGTGLKIPSIKTGGFSPFGFLKNLGSDIATTTENLPQGLYKLGSDALGQIVGGENLGERPEGAGPGWKPPESEPFTKDIGLAAKGFVHGAAELAHPKQFYEHPLEPLLDVATVASLGAGGLAKTAGVISRASAGAGEGSNLANIGATAAKLTKIGSTLDRPSAIVAPGLTERDIAGLSEHGVNVPTVGRAYSPQPLMKYLVQKPLDTSISKLKDVTVPFTGHTVGDLQGAYYGRQLIARTRGQIAAGTAEEYANTPIHDFLESAKELYKEGQGRGQQKFEASMLMSMGIHDLNQLDEYANQIRDGQDIEGAIMTPDMQAAADHRANIQYQDPKFRELIEHPTEDMKELAYHYRRLILADMTKGLPISPQTFETNTLGRLQELTKKTPEELKGELPPHLLPDNNFAKGLYNLQEAMRGNPVADRVPTAKELANQLGVGSAPKRLGLVESAIHSFATDLKNEESPFQRLQDPSYLPGTTLADKIAQVLPQLGLDGEQAQAFARGVPLGNPDGDILPTYVPSVSGEGMKFGVRKERAGLIAQRALGVARFRGLSDVKEPGFYDFKRPFTPRSASARTIGLGPLAHYLKDPTYDSFAKGAMRLDPEMILRHVYQVNRDIVDRKLSPAMIEKLAFKDNEGKVLRMTGPGELVEKLGTQSAHYEFVPTDLYRNYFTTSARMQQSVAEALKGGTMEGEDLTAQIEALTEESAQKFVSEEMEKAARGWSEGVAMPKTFVKSLIEHSRIAEQGSSIGRALSSIQGRWKSAVLSYMPSWLLRTTVGHGLIAVISGTVSPKFWLQAHDYFSDRPILPGAIDKISWGKKYGAETLTRPEGLPYGVNQGSMMHELQDVGQGQREAALSTLPKTITKGVHTATNYQRRAIFLHKLEGAAKQRLGELQKDFEHPGGFWNSKNIDAVLDPAWREEVLKAPDLVEHAFDQVSKVSYTFGQMQPWERRVVKYGMPFYGWYKFITKFVWGMPINYPGRSAILAQLGRIGHEDLSSMGPIPDYLSGALFFDHSNLEKAKYIQMYGLNPFYDFANPIGPGGPLEGIIRSGQFSPIIQAVAAGFGFNPLTGETEEVSPQSGIERGKYGELINTKTGQRLPNVGAFEPIQRMLGTFMRAFPEARMAELAATKGNPVYPESIPLISEHPIGVAPQSRRGNTVLSALGQEFGVQPKTTNISKYQANLLKAITEARKANVKKVAKLQAHLAEK